MKKLTLLLIITQLLFSCITSNKNNKCSTTIICGEVINADSTSPKVLTVLPYDFKLNGDRLATDIAKREYKFNNHFEMTHKHDVAINYNNEFYLFMAEPSDSIYVTIDAKTKEIRFKGSKAEFNTQINAAKSATDIKINKIYKFNLDTNVEGVISQFNEKMQIINDTLDFYCTENNIKNEVKSYLQNNNLYTLANYILGYDRKNEYSSNRYKLVTDEIFDLYNPQRGCSYMYSVHISNLMSDLMKSDSTIRAEIFSETQDIPKLTKLLVDFTLKQPKSLMRDIILSQSAELFKNFSDNINDIFDPRFLDENNYYNPKFLELYVKPIFNPIDIKKVKSISGDISIESDIKYINKDNEIENLGNKNIIEYIKERYKGKVIYIDIWATWCGPCILEMESAKELHKMYKDVKEIEFVNLCLASKAEKWVESIEKNNIDGENYFINGDDAAKLILSHYKLAGYPSFLLIDKTGKMVTTSAHRPSNINKLSEQLEELL